MAVKQYNIDRHFMSLWRCCGLHSVTRTYVELLVTQSARKNDKLSWSPKMPLNLSAQHWPWLSGPQYVNIYTSVHTCMHTCTSLYRISFQTQCSLLIFIDDSVYLGNNNPLIPLPCRHPPSLHIAAPDSSPGQSPSMKMILETKWDLKFCVWQAAWWKGFIAGLDPWKFYANSIAGQAV